MYWFLQFCYTLSVYYAFLLLSSDILVHLSIHCLQSHYWNIGIMMSCHDFNTPIVNFTAFSRDCFPLCICLNMTLLVNSFIKSLYKMLTLESFYC